MALHASNNSLFKNPYVTITIDESGLPTKCGMRVGRLKVEKTGKFQPTDIEDEYVCEIKMADPRFAYYFFVEKKRNGKYSVMTQLWTTLVKGQIASTVYPKRRAAIINA